MRRYIFLALACLITACEPAREPLTPTPVMPDHASMGLSGAGSTESGPPNGEVASQIARLRALTAPFHSFQAAASAGWGTQITNCFSNPQLGGMGFHYGNPALIDGIVDADKPELLLYEPLENGQLRFVAVEYIVPFTAWNAEQPPKLFGLSYHRNEAFGLWILHVWHFRENPRGTFADWNPRVSCRFAKQ